MAGMAGAQTPHASISFPNDGDLCRATIPFFGTAMVAGGSDADFKEWRIEYGEGRNPTQWTHLGGGTAPIKRDPWVRKEVVWNEDTGASGNLADWNTGLVGYGYGEWRHNFNGIYAVRLTAELKNGKTAEKRIALLVGEAILRIHGGTAVCADGLCSYSVPPFAHDGENALVVAVIRYEAGKGTFPTAESGSASQRVYDLLPKDAILRSPIYRVYPSGFETEPPSQIQITLSSSTVSDLSKVHIYSYNWPQKKWIPLKTDWAGKTAFAKVSSLASPEALFVLMSSNGPPEPPTVQWESESALLGRWIGTGEPSSKLRISRGSALFEGEVGDDGLIRCPFMLHPSQSTYEFRIVRPNGEMSPPTQLTLSPELAAPSRGAALQVLGNNEITDQNPVYIECKDPSTISSKDRKSSMGLVVQGANLETLAVVELKRLTPESPTFSGVIQMGPSLGQIPLHRLSNGAVLSAHLGNGTGIRLVYKDVQPPVVRDLESPTHPAVLWSNPADPSTPQLKALNAFSGVQIEMDRDGLKLSGTKPKTTRLVCWPAKGFSVSSGSVLSFDYHCVDAGPWQILVQSNHATFALPLGEVKPYFPILMPSPPLITDGKWHSFEINLSQIKDQKLNSVDQIFMGSWVKASAYKKVDPGFKSASGNVLRLKNLWIGKPSAESVALAQWTAEDPSGVQKSEWWVDDCSDSKAPPEKGLQGEIPNFSLAPVQKGSVRVNLPGAGRWFFHAQARDSLGNRSLPVVWPLRVAPGNQDRKMILLTAAAPQESAPLAWEQPDGKLSLKLMGLNTLFDPGKSELRVEGAIYPVPRNVWDPLRETMTLDKTAFSERAPLGFDGESMTVELILYDSNGRKLEQPLSFPVTIRSPFTWQEGEQAAVLGLKDPKQARKWLASWANPTAPWSELFPHCVQNTLIVCQPVTPKEAIEKKPPFRWERPIRFKPTDTLPVVWRETWRSPASEMLDKVSAASRLDASRPGFKTAFWTWTQEGIEEFKGDRVRAVILLADNQFEMRPIRLEQLADLLNRQPPGSKIRLDGWLHPLHAKSLHLKAPGKRRLMHGYSNAPQWVNARDQEVVLNAGEDWTRFSILIEASKRYVPLNGSVVQGESYW